MKSENQRRISRGFLGWLGGILLLVPAAWAVDIQPQYDDNITAEQRAVIEAKIQLWENRLPHQAPEHVVTISFRNADLGTLFRGLRPGVEPVWAGPGARGERATLAETDQFANDGDGRPTSARITINNNPAINWYTGLEPPVPADKYDLYTVINHEMAHALGFTVQNPRFKRNVTTTGGTRKYEGGGEGGQPSGTLTPADQGTHLDPGSHPDDLMNPTLPPGTRRTPSQLDEDILEDDVWAYPTIEGSLSNFDVWNRCGLIANDFQVTLGGLLAGSITDLYNGVLNPFSDGTVTQDGTQVVIKWGPGPGQVNPGFNAHFGFKIIGDITPLSFKFEWTQNNTVICNVPVSGTTWRRLADNSVRNRITNESTEQVIWVARRVNYSGVPLVLDDLLLGTPIDITAIPIDLEPIPLFPGESLVVDYPNDPTLAAVVMIADFYEDFGGFPGDPYGTWLDAAELVGFGPPLGDLNCDGVVNAFDIDPFILALTDPVAYMELYPDCDFTAADINGDGVVNAFDIDPFIDLLTGG